MISIGKAAIDLKRNVCLLYLESFELKGLDKSLNMTIITQDGKELKEILVREFESQRKFP